MAEHLPKHVKLDQCIPDPSRRWGHILHQPTGEVFSVSEETYVPVLDAHPYEDGEIPEPPEALQEQELNDTAGDLSELSEDELREKARALKMKIPDDQPIEKSVLAAAIADVEASQKAKRAGK